MSQTQELHEELAQAAEGSRVESAQKEQLQAESLALGRRVSALKAMIRPLHMSASLVVLSRLPFCYPFGSSRDCAPLDLQAQLEADVAVKRAQQERDRPVLSGNV